MGLGRGSCGMVLFFKKGYADAISSRDCGDEVVRWVGAGLGGLGVGE